MTAGSPIEMQGATWRGWLLGFLSIIGISIFIPYADFVMRGTMLSFNAFPMIPISLVLGLTLIVNFAVHRFRSNLGITRQDLTLVFCMTTVAYTIPGVGFWVFWSTGLTAASQFAIGGNRYDELLLPYLPEGFFPRDPAEGVAGPRPIEWFYSGLPPGESIPWEAWIGPLWRWGIVVALMYGIWFCLASLLFRRWSEEELLPFPVAQVPEEVIGSVEGGERHKEGLFSGGVVWWGMGLAFLLQGWNSLSTYYDKIPILPLLNWNVQTKYFTEPPWSYLGDVHFHIFPTVIGLTYLISLEIAFSLWFFFGVQKVAAVLSGPTVSPQHMRSITGSQGTGALLFVAMYGIYRAAADLKASLGFGKSAGDDSDESRAQPLTWLILLVCIAGAVMWLKWLGVGVGYGIAIVLLFVVVMTGMARLIAEAGVFGAQYFDFPVHLLTLTMTPAGVGMKNQVLLTIWDRVFTADWFRIVPLPNILNSLHLAGRMRFKRSHAMAAMAAGVALVMMISFGTFFHCAYKHGGVNEFGWFFRPYATGEMRSLANRVAKVEAWEKRQQDPEKKEPRDTDQPSPAADRDWGRIGWIGFGAVAVAAFVFIRRYIFWWPHPAGIIMWMGPASISRLWFSFFLGWLCKWAIVTYGGHRVHVKARRFFIGLVIGEALAAIFWVIVAIIAGMKGAYSISIS